MSRPREALAIASRILSGRPGPFEASVARQAVGIVLRDIGDVNAGVGELRSALRLARRTGAVEREADVLGSLGTALVHAGRTGNGFAAFDRAIQLSSGVMTGRVLHRRGIVLWTLGRYPDGPRRLPACNQRAAARRRLGSGTARALEGRGLVYLAIGSPAALMPISWLRGTCSRNRPGTGSGPFGTTTGPGSPSVRGSSGRALPPRRGCLPLSAAQCADARLRLDRCEVLLAAGLPTEALAEADPAIRDIEQTRGRSTKKAELLLTAAKCALAAAQPQGALDRAQAAHRLFRSQQNTWGQAHSRLALVQARYAVGRYGPAAACGGRAADARRNWARARRRRRTCWPGGWPWNSAVGRDADRHLRAARPKRRRGAALRARGGWLAEALRAEAAGRVSPDAGCLPPGP